MTQTTSLLARDLAERIEARNARVGMTGLRYVGLPLAVEFGRAGFSIVGIDRDAGKVKAKDRGESYIQDVPAEAVSELVTTDRLSATTDISSVTALDTVNICVSTPLRNTKDPDLSYVVAVAEAARDHLHPRLLSILESTSYPDTTEEVLQRTLEQTGMKAGQNFFLAFSPEGRDPGNPAWNTRNVPEVVSGLTRDCTALAAALNGSCIECVIPVGSPKIAEMVKLIKNTFRAINIRLINEPALMCDRIGVNVWWSSMPPHQCRLASCRSTLGRDSAVTASRSIRSTSRGKSVKWDSRPGVLSWLTK